MSRRVLKNVAEAIGVLATLLVVYNLYIFAEVALGKQMEYIPWLHFPIKLLTALVG